MKKLMLLLLIGVCLGCNRQPDTTIYDSGIEFLNENLKKMIVEYNKSQGSPNLIKIARRREGTDNIYRIYASSNLGDFIEPNAVCFIRIDSCYIGYIDMTNNDIGMELSEIANMLRGDFPELYKDYELYLKGVLDSTTLSIQRLTNYDDFEARFSGDSLISKTIIYSYFEDIE